MKKALIVLLLLAVVAGGVFAQLTKEIVVDYVPDLFLYESSHYGDSKINALTSNDFDANELRLNLTYVNGNVKAFLQTKFDDFIRRGISTGFSANSGMSWNTLIGAAFGDYYVDVTNIDMFGGNYRVYLGNTANRGLTDRFQDFHDFLRVKQDNFGILTVNGANGAFASWDVNNLTQTGNHGYTASTPYVGFFANYAPITVAIAGSMNDSKPETAVSNPTDSDTPESYRKINGTLRLSGEKIADLVTFDFIYRIWNYDPNTLDNYKDYDVITFPNYQPDGLGITTHNIGLYANLFVVDNLGIALGYSGSVKTYEDKIINPHSTVDPKEKTVAQKGIFYNGIDLRFKYTGIDKLTLTFNNNFSFASANGSKDDVRMDWLYSMTDIQNEVNAEMPGAGSLLGGEDAKQSYFALYNALAVAYKLSDPLTLKAQIGSKLGSISYADSITPVPGVDIDIDTKAMINQLGVALFAQYAFSPRVEFRFGLDFVNTYYSMNYDVTAAGTSESEDDKGGTFKFGVPIGVKIVF
jgi:hypothetical protein